MTTLKFYKKASTYLCGKDKKLAKIIKQHELSPLELHEDYFRELTESIIGQQLSVKAADTILKRFYALITEPLNPKKVIAIKDDKIRAAGISWSKISGYAGLEGGLLKCFSYSALADLTYFHSETWA
ncbi:MAG: HhH-GPD family protein [Candidatus Levybacteria bacterium GW2011_GWA1_39_32]|nr:MAG: HhH-GPD family protein [Candidatus Levybacteria bacterium GW2011_GWA1_39_32]